MNFDVVLIAGPTASGKSQAALALAEKVGGIIVNADSMQIYRELRVLTARPTDAETARVPHLLFGHVGVRDHYSVGRYQIDAAQALQDARRVSRVPIFAGGTGLYFEALTNGLADVPPVPQAIRVAAREKLSVLGNTRFYAELTARDDTARALRPSDRQRMLRAYEVLEATGRTLSFWQKANGCPVLDGLRTARFVLDVPRETLRNRIEARFLGMLEQGAEEEAAAVAGLDPAMPAAKILGVRELNAARAGEIGRDEAVALAIARTRQFAKRQRTWFRHRMAGWSWIPADAHDKIVTEMVTHLA